MSIITYVPRNKLKSNTVTGTTFLMTGDLGVVEDRGLVISNIGGVTQNATNIKCGTGSIQFASTKYLRIPSESLDFGTEPYTVEFWLYNQSFAVGYVAIITNGKASPNYFNIGFGDSGFGNKLMVTSGLATLPSHSLLSTFTKSTLGNAWHHIAVTKDADSLVRLFIDGVLNSSKVMVGSLVSGTTLGSISTTYFNGCLDNIRFIKGNCLYTSNFTPSTESFTI